MPLQDALITRRKCNSQRDNQKIRSLVKKYLGNEQEWNRPVCRRDGRTRLSINSPQYLITAFNFLNYLYYSCAQPGNHQHRFGLVIPPRRKHSAGGKYNLDEYRNLIDMKIDYRLRVVDGHIYSYYPIATPLLITPIVWMINKVYPIFYPTDFYTYLAQHAPDTHTAKMEKLIAAGFVALSAVFIYLIARQYLGIIKSLFLTFIFAFSTSMWSTASRALWQHGPSVLFLTCALYLLILAKDKPILYPVDRI